MKGITEKAALREHSFQFSIRTRFEDGKIAETSVCRQMFMAVFDITRRRVSFFQNGLIATGAPPIDERGNNKSRSHALSHADLQTVHAHIIRFRGRIAHYSLSDSRRIYLPEELNMSKPHTMYKEQYQKSRVSYEIYRRIFNNSYNISFGYPRKDTCSTCDIHVVKLQQLNADIATCQNIDDKQVLKKERLNIETVKKAPFDES